MKKLFIVAILCFTGTQLSFLYAEEVTGGRLEDVVVREKDQSKVESDKDLIKLDLDYMKVIKPTLETKKQYMEKVTNKLSGLILTSASKIETSGTVSPWLNMIARDPVHSIEFEDKIDRVQSWELIVTDNRGYRFRRFEGAKKVPRIVELDGRDENGAFMRMGNTYAYILKYKSKGGVKKTVIGKPFSILAALHQEKAGLIISIVSKVMFNVRKDPYKLIDGADSYISEAADILKENFNIPVVVKVYAESKSVAKEQAKLVIEKIAKILIVPENKFTIEAHKDVPENYHFDIVIVNRKQG